MLTHDVHFQVLVERVAKLERQNRYWKLGSLTAVLVFALSLAVSLRAQEDHMNIAPSPKSIEAQAFVLKDSDGIKRGEFTVVNGVARIDLYSASGKTTWSTKAGIVTERR